ncbi:MAG: DUF2784 domain-containing protein [Gammaproteobacteria bacterium]|nr:DUF2784 domain-containing protein [Gammaproteobacteria bacterium]
MKSDALLLLAADAILLIHVLFVLFVVLGLFLIIAGRLCCWHWVRNPWFRLVHLFAIVFVVVQAWLGRICPLTTLEMSLRSRAGDAVYPGSFVAHWLQALLYYQAPLWVFAVIYTVFAALVAASWIWVRPRPFFKK